ncbi:MAG: type II toxin-antitoxin system PemK/MazF family toxin [Eubacteriales bacterium]|nr:type II toxin-antitoxin system PemK/MazF family toxin [Eubacteriales bacterium]
MTYIPDQGDIIYLQFNPQASHEQKGTRPAIVVSNKTYNQFTKLAIVCPITSNDKEFPLHVLLDDRTRTMGVIMCEQIKALEINARKASFFEKAPKDIVDEVMDIIVGFIE